MRNNFICILAWVGIVLLAGAKVSAAHDVQPRQDASSADSPSLTSNDRTTTTSPTAATSTSDNDDVSTSSPAGTAPMSSLSPPGSTGDFSLKATSAPSARSTATSSSTSGHPTAHTANSTTTLLHKTDIQLPIKPQITPAFSVGGIILMLTGLIYALIGVKNQWIHTFLSTAYLTSLSITVLIVYVMSPPISDAIEGAYLVAIVMTGIVFGGGALIFKEITEGLGCLLGGFALSMWFLTLKEGGVITNATGKGIFIGVFCVLVWSLSFSHHTRDYGLIASTAFSGATAFVLGIDCFSRAGLKEFWVYLWDLNNDLIPLGTTTYPITHGIRVETAVIVLGTIVGLMSQVKLWKIVRAKQKKRENAKMDDHRRKEVVEEALGRHIERQNDKDRLDWECQYGNQTQSRRSTVLWSEAHPDKSYTHISTREMLKPSRSSSSESLEMLPVGSRRALPLYSSRNKRTGTTDVDVILEEHEDPHSRASMDRERALNLQPKQPPESARCAKKSRNFEDGTEVVPLPFESAGRGMNSKSEHESTDQIADSDIPKGYDCGSRRRSLQSLLSLSPRLSADFDRMSESREALVIPSSRRSRPSSIAATLDKEHDRAALYSLSNVPGNEPATPTVVIAPAGSYENLQDNGGTKSGRVDVHDIPPSPPALSVNLDFDDPEEMTRPLIIVDKLDALGTGKRSSKETKTSTASEGTAKESSDAYAHSHTLTGKTSTADGMTPGALTQLPSQLSNMVMSYRTNEWAKHISTADVPVFDELESIEEADTEPATQIIGRSLPSSNSALEPKTGSRKILSVTSKPPQPYMTSSTFEETVPAKEMRSRRSASNPSEAQALICAPARPPSIQSPSADDGGVLTAPTRSTSVQSSRAAPAKTRSSLKAQMRPSLAATTIHENEPTVFAPVRISTMGSSAGMPNREPSTSTLAAVDMAGTPRASTVAGTKAVRRTDSYESLTESQRSRASSIGSHGSAMKPDTRLDSYDSRQPLRQGLSQRSDKQQDLFAEWRMSQQHPGMMSTNPKQQMNLNRAQMLYDKEHKKLMEEQQRAVYQQKQYAIDQLMRRPDMQELHREAMRKMQAKTKL